MKDMNLHPTKLFHNEAELNNVAINSLPRHHPLSYIFSPQATLRNVRVYLLWHVRNIASFTLCRGDFDEA